MPTGSSNFTTPDTENADNGRSGGATQGTGDNGQVWNPTGGPNGTGAWEMPKEQQRFGTFDSSRWGGQGNDIDGNGNEIQGTSGAARDRDRYLGMAGPVNKAPVIDQTRSDETRDIGIGALGLLRNTAEGNSPSVAEQLGTKQGLDAQNAGYGIAASVRGGPAARAAAARTAQANAGTISQQTLASNRATRAGEMAQARGSYLGAASGMRGQDLGVATSQGNLDAGQRAADDARNSFFEGKAHDTQKADVGFQLGKSANDLNASNAANDLAQRQLEAGKAADQRLTNTALTTAQGGINAYNNTQKPDPDPNKMLSSEETKTDVVPMNTTAQKLKARTRAAGRSLVNDVEAAKLKKQAGDMQAHTEAQRAGMGMSTMNTPGNESAARGEYEVEGYDAKGSPKARVKDRAKMDPTNPYENQEWPSFDRAPPPASLTRGVEAAHAKDTGKHEPDIIREDPYNETLFGHGKPGYAKERAGKPGAFGSHEAKYDLGSGYSTDPFHDPWAHDRPNGADAPGTSDFNDSEGEVTDSRSRAIMGLPPLKAFRMPTPQQTMSDGKTKQNAKPVETPEEKKAREDKEDAETSAAFMKDSKPGVTFKKPETYEEMSKAIDERNAQDKEIAATKKREQQAPAVSYANKSDDKLQTEADSIKYVPLFGRWAQGKVDARRAETDDAKVERATRDRTYELKKAADARDFEAKYMAEGNSEPKTLLGSAAKRVADRVRDWNHNGEQSIGYRPPPRQMQSFTRGDDSEESLKAQEAADRIQYDREHPTTPSDENAKTGMKSEGSSPMEHANRAMAPYEYEYKDGFAQREGQHIGDKNVGPMAQNMEADPIAKTAIVKDPETGLLAIDKSKGLKLVMGGLADMQRQVDELKGRRRV